MQRVKGTGFPINICEMPKPAPRKEAEIFGHMRDLAIKAHCDHAGKGPGHVCAGRLTITAKHMTLQCGLCGDRRMTMGGA